MSGADVRIVLEDLIHQFSDSHAFFRELIQNSIDAGSGEVEINFEFDGDEHKDGVAIIHVNDFGEGMTREIIETKLTRLFSSTKDDDLTKIGRFGIGFVSVYAIEPDAVAVDTARGGETWRVLFKPDRTYELYALNAPIEGTQIRLYKRMNQANFRAFVNRAVSVIRKWCAHVAIPIYVEGQDIRRPFDVEAAVKMSFEEPGTRLVAGLIAHPRANFGFYNRGLTLSEGAESAWSGMTFRLDSRYLEHTLTRDRVLEDKHFHKAKELLDRVHQQTLPDMLVDRLEKSIASGPNDEYRRLMAVLEQWVRAHPALLKNYLTRKILWTDSGTKSLKELQRREGVWISGGAQHVRQFVPNPIYGADPQDILPVLRAVGITGRLVEMIYVIPAPQRSISVELESAVIRIAAQLQFNLKHFRSGSFDYPSSPINQLWHLYLNDDETSMISQTAYDRTHLHPGTFSTLIVDVNSPIIQQLETLAQNQPELAALTLFKVLLAGVTLDAVAEDHLVKAAFDERLRRITPA